MNKKNIQLKNIVESPREERSYRIAYFQAIHNMYEGISSSVRMHDGATNDFLITILL